MGDEVELTNQAAPTSPPPAQFDYLQSPGQRNAPTNAAEQRHGLCLQFKFQHTSSNSTNASRATRPDTFNAVEAVHGLADTLFTSSCNVIIHDTRNSKRMKDLTKWPTNDTDFASFFEVHIPSNRKTTAFVRFAITSSQDYKNLKKDGLLYQHLRANSIFMMLHQFSDIETTTVGVLLFKHPKLAHWQRYREMLQRQMHHALHTDKTTHLNNASFLNFDFTNTEVPYFTISNRSIQHTISAATDPSTHNPDQLQENQPIYSTVFKVQ